MAKSSRPKGRRPDRQQRAPVPRRRRLGRRLFGLFLMLVVGGAMVGGLALAVYMAKLDQVIQEKFAGKRWALPARVYARPLQLFPGAQLSPQDLAEELALLPYRKVDQLNLPGSYVRQGDTYEIYTRSFKFWDGPEPARKVKLTFAGDTLKSLTSLDGQPDPPLLRLEPAEIAGIYPASDDDRILVRYQDIPPVLIDTLIAVEDRSFYDNFGIDFKGILRALWADIRAGHIVQGGSTLTQQLVKNFFLSDQRTFKRKLKEMLMALLVEWHYSKQEILEAYSNEIYLGQNGKYSINGFALASRFYFNRTLNELDLPQIALLVGMVRAPSYYNPRRYPEHAKDRRATVLDIMVQQNLISRHDAEIAKQKPLEVTPEPPQTHERYPAFLQLVQRQLQHNYREQDLTSEGLRIFTTLDPEMQATAEQAIQDELPKLEQEKHLPKDSLQAAAVVVDTQTGEVRALVGGRDPRIKGFNRALDIERPVGSLLKPAIYLTALEHPARYTLITPISDEKLVYRASNGKVWEPHNYDNRYHGEVLLENALAHSYNIATARLGLDLTVKQVIDTLHTLGLNKPLQPYPSLLLGAIGASPFDITQLYSTLASGGYRLPLRSISEVTAATGAPLPRLYELQLHKVVDPGPAYLITRAMQRVVALGTARAVGKALPNLGLAGKTGTTDDFRDSWFAGFSGNLLTVVWVGRDDNDPTRLSGASGALPVWLHIMEHLPLQPLDPTPPSDIQQVLIDPSSGDLADNSCPHSQLVPFMAGSAPQQWAPCSSQYSDRSTGYGNKGDDSMSAFFRRLLQ